MRHLSADTHGAPSWSPGWSTVTRNLLVNSYGAGHGIDHDDGAPTSCSHCFIKLQGLSSVCCRHKAEL